MVIPERSTLPTEDLRVGAGVAAHQVGKDRPDSSGDREGSGGRGA